MPKPRWNRLETLSATPPITLWPTVLESNVAAEYRELFRNRCNAVTMYVEGAALSDIEKTTGIHRNLIQPLTTRCIEVAGDGRIYGFRAIIPFLRIKNYERSAAIKPKFREGQGGLSGVFRHTLNKHPALERELKQLILKKNSPEHNVHEKKIQAGKLHNFFLKSLKEAGVMQNEWPFNTKHLGLKTIEKYMDEVLDDSFSRSVRIREEQPSLAHMAVGSGHERFLSFEEPYDVVELDAYSINAFFSAEFETPEGATVEVQLDRLWLIAMIERVSDAILSYMVVYRSEISADDVLTVIRKALNPPVPIELTVKGLKYPDKGGLPSEVFPQCVGAAWNAMMLDGALAHLSKAVRERARSEVGFVLNWGPVGHFERRPNIERFFKKISDDVFMRYPSTTGSNPSKGRAKNAEENAVTYKLRSDEAEQLIAVYMAQHNATPNAGTSYLSPLDVLEYYLIKQADHFLLRHLPAPVGGATCIIPLKKECTIRGGRQSGRRPYVEVDKVRYTNPVLSQSVALIGKKIIVEIDEDDMRFVKAYLPNGAEIGFLKAGGRWYVTKHSRKTRRIINSLIANKTLVISGFDDPVQIYMDYLSKRNKSNKKNKGKAITPSQATEATRVAKESGLPKKVKPEFTKELSMGMSLRAGNTPQPTLINRPIPDMNKFLKK